MKSNRTIVYESRAWSLGSHSVFPPTACPGLVLGHGFLLPGTPGPTQPTPLSALPWDQEPQAGQNCWEWGPTDLPLPSAPGWGLGGSGGRVRRMPHAVMKRSKAVVIPTQSWQHYGTFSRQLSKGLSLTPNPGTENFSAWRLKSLGGHTSAVGWRSRPLGRENWLLHLQPGSCLIIFHWAPQIM